MALTPLSKALVTGLLLAASTAGLAELPTVLTIGIPSKRNLVLQLAEAPPDASYTLLQVDPDAGTIIRHPIVTGSSVPFNSSWSELTDAQKTSLRTHYEAFPADDEPPFPDGGLYSVYKPISDTVNYMANFNLAGIQTFDSMTVGMVVDPTGHVTRVNVYSEQAPSVTDTIVAGLPQANIDSLLKVRFKPGMCHGQPCQMEFPIRFTVARLG